MKWIAYFLLLVCLVTTAAARSQSALPKRCLPRNFAFRDGELVLAMGSTEPKQFVFFIKNISNDDIWFDHPHSAGSLSAGWASRLSPRNWSAFALNGKGFALTCTRVSPGKREPVDCESVVKACEYSKTKVDHSSKGTYWAVEDQPFYNIRRKLAKRGVWVH